MSRRSILNFTFIAINLMASGCGAGAQIAQKPKQEDIVHFPAVPLPPQELNEFIARYGKPDRIHDSLKARTYASLVLHYEKEDIRVFYRPGPNREPIFSGFRGATDNLWITSAQAQARMINRDNLAMNELDNNQKK